MIKLRLQNKTLVSLLELLEVLKQSPMRALRRCRNNFRTSTKTHHETVHETIAFIVAFVLHLQQSPEELNEFLTDEYWEGKPQQPKEKNLVRLTAMYTVEAKQSNGALYQQALDYTKVANHFIALGVEPEAIPDELKRKPIYKIIDELQALQPKMDEAGKVEGGRSRAQTKSGKTDETATSDEDKDNDDLNDDEDLPQEPAPRLNEQGDRNERNGEKGGLKKTEPSSDTPKVKRKRYPFDPYTEVAIRHNGMFDALCKMKKGDDNLVRIVIKRIDDNDDGGWQWEMVEMEDMT